MVPKTIASDMEIRTSKAIGGKPTDFVIKAAPGLRLRVMESGFKSWSLIYTRQDGKKRRIRLGEYPGMSLKDARSEAQRLRVQVGDGADPAQEKRAAKRPSTGVPHTMDDLIAAYCVHYEKMPRRNKRMRKPRTIEETKRMLVNDVGPEWEGRGLDSIKRADVSALLASIAADHAVKGNRVLSAIRPMFKWACKTGYLEANPCADVDAPSPEVSRARVLTDSELRLAWTAAGKLRKPREAGFVKVLALLLQRRVEVAAMRWDEIDFDQATWLIPGGMEGRTKNWKEHLVPLPTEAIAILAELKAGAGAGEYVFGPDDGRTPLSCFSQIKRGLDALIAAENDGQAIAPWRFHDLRRTGDTTMHRLGVLDTVVDAVLNHTIGGVRGVYNRWHYAPEKRAALEQWAAFLVEGTGSNVVPIDPHRSTAGDGRARHGA